jgi:uncharacterized protein (DUF4415 family)
MAKKEHIVHYTAAELKAMQKRGESKTDWARVAATTEAETEAAVAVDADEFGMTIDWDNASIEMPEPKAVLNMRVDRHVLEFFKHTGRGYQTRINAVLRSFVDSQDHRTR